MSKLLEGKRIALYTLGCKVNQYESDSVEDLLRNAGALIVPFESDADVYFINTCAVTNMAERKCRQIINRAKKKNENAIVVGTGCYVQSVGEVSGVDIVLSNNKKTEIVSVLENYFADMQSDISFDDINKISEYENMTLFKPTEHTRAFVKVEDGCNNFCTYCIIPYTRGRIRSRSIASAVNEIKGLAERGIKEVVLTGINLSAFTDGEDGSRGLKELIEEVSKIEGILRIRLGSLEPRVITPDFLESLKKNKKFCPHFHLSLQSACNETLKRMNRKYTIEEYAEKCELIREYFEYPALTTDVIVGFPGETDEEFNTTVENLEKLNLYEMHIFKYSKRRGTIAADMPNQVDEQVKTARSDVLLAMTARHKAEYEKCFGGKTISVLVELVEEREDGWYLKGHTDRYILVEKLIDENLGKDFGQNNQKIVNTIIDVIYQN